MDEQQDRILSLLQKYETGEASPEELQELDIWYASFEQEADFTEGLSAEQEQAKRYSQLQRFNVRLDRELAGEIVHLPKKQVRLWPRIAIAASVLLCLSIGFYFYKQKANTDQVQLVQNLIKPGGNKAILTLANGTKISLTDAINGKVATQSGVVITKTANGQLVYQAAASEDVNTAPEYNTVEAPVGGQWQVKLPDGSIVFLNALSSITYPTRFIGKERNVKISGEAYFEIAHNKAMPFKVSSLGQTVEVLGTHFNVMAYADEKVIKTTLLEGSVKISDHEKTKILKPGQQAQVSASTIKVTDDIDLEDVVAWKNGYFKFNENLESIMSKVARWYNVEVVYKYKPDPQLTFSGELPRNKDISTLLKIIGFNGDVHFKIEGRRVIVMK